MAIAVRQRPARKLLRPGHRLLRHDRALGVPFVAGTDEAGRGALAGPLVAAGVLFDYRRLQGRVCTPLAQLDDSKTRTLAQREELYEAVVACATRVSVIVAPAREVDRRGVHRANLTALARALRGLDAPPGALLLSDGFRVPLERDHRAIIGGDGTSAAIAAASIVAKVTRDRIMRRLHAAYPDYGFDGHVGYSTPQHRDALLSHGPCPLHRRSFATVGAVQLSLLAG
ncbi:MAG: ribonuclease [Gaiellales bacterium]|jgi:ribonuclease HII|nr:ribonuclease [Gaiellales bacterium]MDX6596887.1 ribonuclease [Gaiellales bacterium]